MAMILPTRHRDNDGRPWRELAARLDGHHGSRLCSRLLLEADMDYQPHLLQMPANGPQRLPDESGGIHRDSRAGRRRA